MTHPDLMILLAQDRIADLRRSAGPVALRRPARQRTRKLALLANRSLRLIAAHSFRGPRPGTRRLDGIEPVNRGLVRSR